MAYNNGNFNNGGFRNNNSRNGGFQNNGFNGRFQNGQPYRKRSGAGIAQWVNEKGMPGKSIWAWRRDRNNGFMQLSAYWVTQKGLKGINKLNDDLGKPHVGLIHKAASGIEYERMFVNIHYKDRGEFKSFTGFYNKAKGQLRIPALGHVVNVKKGAWVKSRPVPQNRR